MMFCGHVQTFSPRGNACSTTHTPMSCIVYCNNLKNNILLNQNQIKKSSCSVDFSISCQCFCLLVTFFVFLFYFCFVLMWPRFDSGSRRHMWVEFVVGSCPCSEGFSLGTPVFLPPQKLTFPNSNSTRKQWMEEPPRGIHKNSYFFFSRYLLQEPQTFIVQFQKKSIPSPWKVIGNS